MSVHRPASRLRRIAGGLAGKSHRAQLRSCRWPEFRHLFANAYGKARAASICVCHRAAPRCQRMARASRSFFAKNFDSPSHRVRWDDGVNVLRVLLLRNRQRRLLQARKGPEKGIALSLRKAWGEAMIWTGRFRLAVRCVWTCAEQRQ